MSEPKVLGSSPRRGILCFGMWGSLMYSEKKFNYTGAVWCVTFPATPMSSTGLPHKRGWTVTTTPMDTLFRGAQGVLRSVRLDANGMESEDGQLMHCVQDAIQFICDVSAKRAGSIWRDDISASTKHRLKLRNESEHGPCKANSQNKSILKFIFHSKPVPVLELKGLMIIINALNSGSAVAFRQRFVNITHRYIEGDPTLHAEIDINKGIGIEASAAKFFTECHADAMVWQQEEESREGYVYGAVSDAFPNHIKIGFTYNLQQRLADANTFCAMKPFKMVAYITCPNPRHVEAAIHSHFSAFRRAGEFFEISVHDFRCCLETWKTQIQNTSTMALCIGTLSSHLDKHIAGVKRMRDECESAVRQSQIMVDNARVFAEHMSSILSCSLQTMNELEKTAQLQAQQLEKEAQLYEEMLDRKAKRLKMEDESKDRELVELQNKLDIELENERKKTDLIMSLAERSATVPTHKFSVLFCLK